jgi:uncharacterized damage-inducible protein DinB
MRQGGGMKRFLLLTVLVVFCAASVPAQTVQKDVLLKHWKASSDFTLAVAGAMPAEGYNFRPVPEEMSFGDVMAHISVANRGACANASGLTPPDLPPKIADWLKDHTKVEVDKDTALQFMKDTFAFCYRAITEVPVGRLDTVVGPPNRNMTGTEWLWSYFTHTAHHRGQAEVYLRLKGIKPPPYSF